MPGKNSHGDHAEPARWKPDHGLSADRARFLSISANPCHPERARLYEFHAGADPAGWARAFAGPLFESLFDGPARAAWRELFAGGGEPDRLLLLGTGEIATFLWKAGVLWRVARLAADRWLLIAEPPPPQALCQFHQSHCPMLGSVLNAMPGPATLMDSAGRLLSPNLGWRRLERDFPNFFRESGVAADSSAVLDEEALRAAVIDYAAIRGGLGKVFSGEAHRFQRLCDIETDAGRLSFDLRVEAVAKSPELISALVLREVTDEQRAVLELRESHALFQSVVEATSDAIFMYDTKGRFVISNAANCEALGATASRVMGRTAEEVFPAGVASVIREQNALVLSAGRALQFELAFETARGRRTLSVSKGPYRNHRGEIVGIIGVGHDITERKRAEESLARSERHFRALIENSGDRVAIVDRHGVITYASPSSRRLFGFESGELVGGKMFPLIHPADVREFEKRFGELIELPGASITGEYRLLCKNGSWVWVEFTATQLLDDESVRGIVFNERDVSERKRAELELNRLAAIVKSSYDAIIALDTEAVITSWNSAAQRLFGYTEREALGRNISIIVPPDLTARDGSLAFAVLKGRVVEDYETVRLAKDGRRVDVSLTLSMVRDQDRRVVGVSGILRDISERKRLEREVLEISDREKQRLGQDLHDDLCQHLVGISMLGNLLAEDLGRQGLAQASEAARITELLRKAVDHARSLARGLSPLNLEGSGLMAGLESLVLATERLFRVPCALECAAPVYMKNGMIAMHLYRIAQEALHNAVKHSQCTRAVVKLEAGEGALCLSVTDNGTGLPKDLAEAGPSADGHQGGLGMHTMRYRARVIGAELELQANPGGGTRVLCRLPNRRKPV